MSYNFYKSFKLFKQCQDTDNTQTESEVSMVDKAVNKVVEPVKTPDLTNTNITAVENEVNINNEIVKQIQKLKELINNF